MTKVTLVVYTLVLLLIVALAKVDAEARELDANPSSPGWLNSSY